MTFGNYYFAGGPASLIVIVFTILALFASVIAVVVTLLVRNAIVPAIFGFVLIIFALGIAAVGIGKGLYDRSKVAQVLADPRFDPEQREIMRAVGEKEANQPLIMGILGSALPGLGGLALVIVALKRRSESKSAEA